VRKTRRIEIAEAQQIARIQAFIDAIDLVGGREWEFKKQQHPNAESNWLNGVEYGFILALERLESVRDELCGIIE
jgi:hypothetical protein